MAIAALITSTAIATSPALALVVDNTTWADAGDVRAIAAAILACDALSATLANLPAAGNAAYAMGAICLDTSFSRTSRDRFQLARPTNADSVLGGLWGALDAARSAWIRAQLADAGLADVWTSREPASRADLLRAHDMEGELEASAPSVPDVVNAARTAGQEG